MAKSAIEAALAYPDLGEGSQPYAKALLHLASVQAAMRKHEEALETLHEHCAVTQRARGEDCAEIVPALHAMSEVLEMQGEMSRAVESLCRARDVRRTHFGRGSMEYAFSCHNLASLLARQVGEDAMMRDDARGASVERIAALVMEAADIACSDEKQDQVECSGGEERGEESARERGQAGEPQILGFGEAGRRDQWRRQWGQY